jgi:hypothetical protein
MKFALILSVLNLTLAAPIVIGSNPKIKSRDYLARSYNKYGFSD